MSNEEKKRLEEYRKRRARLILIQGLILVVLASISIVLLLSYRSVKQTYYVNYSESGMIDYRVSLRENDFYDEEYLGKNQDYGYVSNLINKVEAAFNYVLDIDSPSVTYNVNYKAVAKLQVKDTSTSKVIYKPIYELSSQSKEVTGADKLNITANVTLDYHEYNSEALRFIETLSLNATEALVLLEVEFNVTSSSADFDNFVKNHTMSISIPLDEAVVKFTEYQSVSTENKVIECDKSTAENLLLVFSIITLSLLVIGSIVLVIFIVLTRNTFINYSIKVKRILNSYRSFIQKITNEFDTTGYKVLFIASMNELLEIRDTLQSPILMSENEDKTKTQFIIPTNNDIVYIYEVKIDNYDEIYAIESETAVMEEIAPTEEIEDTPVIAEDESNVEEEIEDVDNNYSLLQYNYSFESKLVLSSDEIQSFYQEIIKFVKEYGVKVSRSFKRERVYQGRNILANLIYRGKTLCILFPVNPKDEQYAKYRFIDMSEYKKYSETPALIKVTSARKVKYVIEVLESIFKRNNLEDKKLIHKPEVIKRRSKAKLIKEGLIKKNTK